MCVCVNKIVIKLTQLYKMIRIINRMKTKGPKVRKHIPSRFLPIVHWVHLSVCNDPTHVEISLKQHITGYTDSQAQDTMQISPQTAMNIGNLKCDHLGNPS